MKAKIRTGLTLVVVMLLSGLFSLEQSTWAQSENSNCKEVKGNLWVSFGPGVANGTITNGGIFNGTVATIFNDGSVVPTADPTTVTFTGDTVITTNAGVLVTHDVYVFDFVRSLGPGMLRIDPSASTGIFAGATGVVYLNVIFGGPESGQAKLAGQICFAKE